MKDDKFSYLVDHLYSSIELADCSISEAVNVAAALLAKVHSMNNFSLVDTVTGTNVLVLQYFQQYQLQKGADILVDSVQDLLKHNNEEE